MSLKSSCRWLNKSPLKVQKAALNGRIKEKTLSLPFEKTNLAPSLIFHLALDSNWSGSPFLGARTLARTKSYQINNLNFEMALERKLARLKNLNHYYYIGHCLILILSQVIGLVKPISLFFSRPLRLFMPGKFNAFDRVP